MKSQRLDKYEFFLQVAELFSKQSTCIRKSVGCVLTNIHNHVIATGYNGVASGIPHCNYESDISEVSLDLDNKYVHACSGAFAQSGTNLDACGAIHAEQNALLQCKNTQEIETCYCTHSPCIQCIKMLMNTSCKHIVFRTEYPHEESKNMWLSSSDERTWIHLP